MHFSDGPASDVFAPDGRLCGELFHTDAFDALGESVRYAVSTHWDSLRSPHVFMGLLAAADPGVLAWAERLGADLPRLVQQFAELFYQDEGETGPLRLHREFMSDNVIQLLRDARVRADDHGRDAVSTLDLLISVLAAPNSIVAECFERVGVKVDRLTELARQTERASYRPV